MFSLTLVTIQTIHTLSSTCIQGFDPNKVTDIYTKSKQMWHLRVIGPQMKLVYRLILNDASQVNFPPNVQCLYKFPDVIS